MSLRTAIDVGGTFTDVLAVDGAGAFRRLKLPSAGGDLADNVRAAIGAAVNGGAPPAEVLYGTTLALNALLAHRLPTIGLVVSAGFREVLETARLPAGDGDEARRTLPRRLVPLEWVSEIAARLEPDGRERTPVDEGEVAAIARRYRDADVPVVAVSLLHSYVNDAHERTVAAVFAREAPHVEVVLSADVLPELREYERTLATCLNACLVPPMRGHVRRCLPEGAAHAPLRVMTSAGGLVGADAAVHRPLATALSGPGAAVVGMSALGRALGRENLITFDVGGTSTDCALVRDGRCATTTEGTIAGYPLRSPMLDVFTLGAGGGSLAAAGPDGRWRVGPESAGAEPGPACYGRGGETPTLTDAQLVLGRLPAALLGGALPLDADAAHEALATFGAKRGFDAARTARGLLEIATHAMCGAVRRVSVLRGHDPNAHTLVAIGGAGPLHAAELAGLLGMDTVLVPPHPGLAAPLGLLVADMRRDFVHAWGRLEDAPDVDAARDAFAALAREADTFLAAEGIADADRCVQLGADLRYAGMLCETAIPLPGAEVDADAFAGAVDAFHDHFERLTGHSHRGQEPVEIVNLRVTAIGGREKPALLRPLAGGSAAPAPVAHRPVGWLHHAAPLDSAVYAREALGADATVDGPAVIEQYESTVLVPPGAQARTDVWGNLWIACGSTR